MTSRRPSRDDVSRMLRADVEGTQPAPGVARRLAATAVAAASSTVTPVRSRRRIRGLAAGGLVGIALAGGIGASYAGVIDVPGITPADHSHHGDQHTEHPSPPAGTSTTPTATSTTDLPGRSHTPGDGHHAAGGPAHGAATNNGKHNGEISGKGNGKGADNADAQHGTPSPTPGAGTGKGKGHGPGGVGKHTATGKPTKQPRSAQDTKPTGTHR